MIKIEESSIYTPYGWWVGEGRYLGKVYEMDRDKRNHHLSWAWTNWKLLGLTEEQSLKLAMFDLNVYQDYEFNEKGLNDLCDELGCADRLPELLDMYSQYDKSEWEDIGERVEKDLRRNWSRVIYNRLLHELYFEVLSDSDRSYDAMKLFLKNLPSCVTKVSEVYVVTAKGQVIWRKVSYEEALNSSGYYSMWWE